MISDQFNAGLIIFTKVQGHIFLKKNQPQTDITGLTEIEHLIVSLFDEDITQDTDEVTVSNACQ